MIAFENISIFIVILTLLCAFGSLVIALLCLSQQEKDKAKIKMPILPDPQDGWCPYGHLTFVGASTLEWGLSYIVIISLVRKYIKRFFDRIYNFT